MSDDLQYKITDPAEMIVERQTDITRHPGTFVREEILPAYGLNVSTCAAAIDYHRATLQLVLSGQKPVTNALAYKLGALTRPGLADLLIDWQAEWTKYMERDERAAIEASIQPRDLVIS